MTKVNVTTSIPLELYNKAIEKHIKWSECLILGIKSMLGVELAAAHGETFEKPHDDKARQIQKTMQETIDQLNDELEKTKVRKKNGQIHY